MFIAYFQIPVQYNHVFVFREKKYSLFPSSRQWPTEAYSVSLIQMM